MHGLQQARRTLSAAILTIKATGLIERVLSLLVVDFDRISSIQVKVLKVFDGAYLCRNYAEIMQYITKREIMKIGLVLQNPNKATQH